MRQLLAAVVEVGMRAGDHVNIDDKGTLDRYRCSFNCAISKRTLCLRPIVG
jgi:hypothetical protein